MKAPRSNVHQIRPNPMQAPTASIPPEYLQMAAAHMMKLGKQVFENQPPSVDQLTASLSGNNPQGQ
jgi:hypothetical protein